MNIKIVKKENIEELHNYFEECFHDLSGMIFRGQRDSCWPLETSLDRLLSIIPKDKITEDIVKIHFSKFKKNIRGRRGINPPQFKNDNEIWALGQHYGLATPLLDWSLSPYISLFFAYNSPDIPSSKERALWALDMNKVHEVSNRIKKKTHIPSDRSFRRGNQYSKHRNIKKIPKENKPYFGSHFEKYRIPVVDIVEPSSEDNPRLINQAGFFTRSPIRQPLEDWVSRHGKKSDGVILHKIIVDEYAREGVLTSLELMNIHSSSLFPDITGAALHCNETLALDVERYKTKKAVDQILFLLKDVNF